jgi:phospholipase C
LFRPSALIRTRRGRFGLGAAATVAVAGTVAALSLGPVTANASSQPAWEARTATPIKHVVEIFGENISFDHYFGTYPYATNTDGTKFTASRSTPRVNNLVTSGALKNNPNEYKPSRLTPAEALTCDQNHNYLPEQKAVDNGKMDQFVQNTSTDTCTGLYGSPGLAMDYYDGNTVSALWNYAQNYSMSDNSWDTIFGPSTPGALNLVSGQTHGGTAVDSVTGATVEGSTSVVSQDANGVGSVISDPDPYYDDCSDSDHTATSNLVKMSGKNIGDLLNAKGVTWGWFQGGYTPTTAWDGKSGDYAKCDATTANVGGSASKDYSPHHNPFAYYASTANPHHLAPSSDAMIGHSDQANHQYDTTAFTTALKQNNLPSVSFLKAPEAQDGHAAYSDPLDEQKFIVNEINAIEQSPSWSSTAIVINYDDSDGWYDHVAPKIINGSHDATNDSTVCSTARAGVAGGYADRCGPSQRLPYMVISPFSKQNSVDHSFTEQTATINFIEKNWGLGTIGDSSFDRTGGSILGMFDFSHPQQREVLLDPTTGAVTKVVSTHPTKPGKPGKPGWGNGGGWGHGGGHGHH